jgi:cysteine desulfurase
MRIYFDNAATTPIAPEVLDVMAHALAEYYGNPSSIHAEGRKARAIVEQARKSVANCLGASIGEIFFTSCGTESNNMILKGSVSDLGVQRIISTKTEHHAVTHPLEHMEKEGVVEVVYLAQDKRGRIDPEELKKVLAGSEAKTLVSLMHANNEIGTMIDLDEISEICQEYNALFHSDTTQTIGYFPIDLSKTKINFITGSAHKFYGPKGVGFIYINGDNILQPFIEGGAQERNMRAGTENIAGILGLAKAMELSYEHLEERREKIMELRQYMIDQLTSQLEDIQFNGDWNGRTHYKILSVSFPPSEKSEMLLLNLDIAGISVSGGSACSSGADAGSHVLSELLGDSPRKTIRFSFSHKNTKEEVDMVVKKLKELVPVSV